MKDCRMKDAPSYFDYWANCNTGERCAQHYAAAYGGIPMKLCVSFASKKLNDGNTYMLGWKGAWQYPDNYPI